MEEGCQIVFRAIRIGSLRTYPPKDSRNTPLKLTRDELVFRVVLEQRGLQKDAIKITVPCKGITLLEGHLTNGCPVIWVTTDRRTAEQIRTLTEMRRTMYPSPYFDPKSKELADQRICIIPTNDPLSQHEIVRFRKVVELIAKEKRTKKDRFFIELARKNANEQLIQCTQYISQLTRFRSAFHSRTSKTNDLGEVGNSKRLSADNCSSFPPDKRKLTEAKPKLSKIKKQEDTLIDSAASKRKNGFKNSTAAAASPIHRNHDPPSNNKLKYKLRLTPEIKRRPSPDLCDFDSSPE